MEKDQNKAKSSGAQITSSSLLSLDDESIQRMMAEDWRVEDLYALKEIGQKLQKCAEAKLEESFRDYYVTCDVSYVSDSDFGIKENNLKRFASNVRNLNITGKGCHNGKKTAAFIESNFPNLRRIALEEVTITDHMKNIFKNVDTVIFNNCHNVGGADFCYHDDCLRYCEPLRCLRYKNDSATKIEAEKFNAIMRLKYSELEKVQFDFPFTPKMVENWQRFIQRNPSITSLTIRFLNENEGTVLEALTAVVDNSPNLKQLFLQVHLDLHIHKFDFKVIYEQLAILDRREHYECLGIDIGNNAYKKIINLDICTSLRSLKSLVIGHVDPCEIISDISKYSSLKVLSLYSFPNVCNFGNHKNQPWNYQFPNLEELNFYQVANAYFFIPFFIRHSPKLIKIMACDCKIVLENCVEMSMRKFNDERAIACSSGEELVIYSDQDDIQSNYEFNLVKLKHIDFEEIPFNEINPFVCIIEDKVGFDVFNKNQLKKKLRSTDSDYKNVQKKLVKHMEMFGI